jgi:hypothetical protein
VIDGQIYIVESTYSLTHGAQPFLRSRQFCNHSRNSQHFMEPKGSLTCSQGLSTGPYPEPDQFNPYHPIPSKLNLLVAKIKSPIGSQVVCVDISSAC